jgi:hypothetical protein
MQGHTFGVKETLMIHSRRGQSSKHNGQGSEKLLFWIPLLLLFNRQPNFFATTLNPVVI